jgi:hypothetical protein
MVLGVRCGSWVMLVALWWAQIPLVPFPPGASLFAMGAIMVLMPAWWLAWAVVVQGARPISIPRQLAHAGLGVRWFHAQAGTWSLAVCGWPGCPILVSRGLIERMPADALLALVHHELAHHRFADVIVLSALFIGAWWLTDTALLAGAGTALVSRWMAYRADAYAARRTSPEHLLQALASLLMASCDRPLVPLCSAREPPRPPPCGPAPHARDWLRCRFRRRGTRGALGLVGSVARHPVRRREHPRHPPGGG